MKKTYIFYLITFTTGALALGYEILISRLVLPFWGDSTFVWAGVISITLLYIAIGSLAGGMMADKYGNAFSIYALIPLVSALTSILLVVPCYHFLVGFFKTDSILPLFIVIAGLLIFSLPILIISTLLPIITRLLTDDNYKSGTVIGRVYAVNTIGSIFGALSSASFFLPQLGPEGSIYCFASVLLLVSFIMRYIRKAD